MDHVLYVWDISILDLPDSQKIKAAVLLKAQEKENKKNGIVALSNEQKMTILHAAKKN